MINDEDSPLFDFHHFYVNEVGWKTFVNQGPSPYPEGTVFVGAVYEVSQEGMQYNEGRGAVYTVMQKQPMASETGGWLFGTFRAKGELMEQDVETACYACHQPFKERDFVFSRPLGLSLPRPATPR